MPVRIYEIAKRLGIESKEVLSKAKELGIAAARVPSSSLDKITAEYLEEKLGGVKVAETPAPASTPAQPIVVVGETPTAPPPGDVPAPAAILDTNAPTETATSAPAAQATPPAIEIGETVVPEAEAATPVAEPPAPPKPVEPPAPKVGEKIGSIQLPQKPRVGEKLGSVKLPQRDGGRDFGRGRTDGRGMRPAPSTPARTSGLSQKPATPAPPKGPALPQFTAPADAPDRKSVV